MTTPLLACLCCTSQNLEPSLDLGTQPLANEFLKSPDEPQESYPLAVNLCRDCLHLQLTHVIDPDLMFKHYIYVSGTSDTYRRYLADFAAAVNVPDARVLDIGCNDGTQLDAFKVLGARTWGVDPAQNLWPVSTAKGHDVKLGYFDGSYEPGVLFDVINAQNVFAHNSDPLSFLQNIKRLLAPEGRAYIQTSQADMVQNGEFDTIYHEHVNFFNAWSMKQLVERSGLVLLEVRKTPIHGTSFMFVLGLEGKSAYVKKDTKEMYDVWARKCRALVERVRRVTRGKRVVAYGAAAKGNTFLNFARIKPDAIIDDNPLKQGTWSPGQRAPVVSKEYLKSLEGPVTFMPLAWNLFDEIKKQIQEVRGGDDEFVHIGHGPVQAWWVQPWECDFRTHPAQSPLMGLLTESRDHPHLEATLRNFSCMFPYAALCVIHSKENKERVENIIGSGTNVRLLELPEGPFGRWENNAMIQKPEFWGQFRKFHRVLMFGTDTGIKQNTILRFMHFDYIGARWYHDPLGNSRIYQGNGGFSLRNPRLMEELLTRFPPPKGQTPDDLWVAKTIHEKFPGACMPLTWECEMFSTETRDLPGTLGFHDVDTYVPEAIEAYEVIDGPKRSKLLEIKSAYVDGVVNVAPLIRIGVGPAGLRVFKETRLGVGKVLELNQMMEIPIGVDTCLGPSSLEPRT